MAKAGLKSALDQYRGRNIRLEKQRKKEKEARKRKEAKAAKLGEDGVSIEEEKEEVKSAQTNGVTKKAQKASKPEKKNKKEEKKAAPVEQVGEDWETEESEEGSEDDGVDFSRLEDSDSEAEFDDDEDEEDDDEEGDEEDEDIPLSDIESLASEDREDVIPFQRLTINNTTALTAALNRISLPYSKLTFSEYQTITSDEPVEIEDVEDDLNRELAFYKQSLSAVKDARAKLTAEGVPFSRPVDYFAEMVKSDEHMGKIKQKLVDEAAGKKAAAEARKQRDLKKFGKQVQVAKLQERAKEKRETLEKINTLKRKRQGAEVTNTQEDDLFDVELDKATTAPSNDRQKPNHKRAKKDHKYGFGGKKRHAKSNDAFSTSDTRGPGKPKGKGGAAKQRPGKSRRTKR
ncbi:Ebp2-domain-containing protein [Sporormia fimetaria CBS 119925]|uniref:Ebp2-domain-containing protein n=1 Tax=Sporormia fimetaria CBS 119925 TaxID=1340428 RepID=A0A6A6V602_9PLEO|nr:Ebp2-domain-containing protein [Sporormia fimetaria CBS 119925]